MTNDKTIGSSFQEQTSENDILQNYWFKVSITDKGQRQITKRSFQTIKDRQSYNDKLQNDSFKLSKTDKRQ